MNNNKHQRYSKKIIYSAMLLGFLLPNLFSARVSSASNGLDLLDDTPPTVLSITLADPSTTNQDVVEFIVTFSEPVTGIDMVGPEYDDFALTTSPGITGAYITNVSGSGAVYMVTVSTGTGDGTIRLDVVATTADVTPPSDITDLIATTGSTNGTVDLSWTAPGDNGSSGTASGYLVRYSSSIIDSQSVWDNATPVVINIPTPQTAGSNEAMTVAGLTTGATYYFAVRTQDEVPNTSGLSNSPSGVASPDTTAPAAITNLAATTGGLIGTINLTWTAPGDNNSTGTATSYLVRYSSSAITD